MGGVGDTLGGDASAADLVARHPWQHTALGARPDWDHALTSAIGLILDSPLAMALVYGDDFQLIYNDAYAVMLGQKHPDAFGQPAAGVFPEVWPRPGVGDVVEHVYRTGEPFLEPEMVLPVARAGAAGAVEQGVFTRGYSPVRDSAGKIIGVLMVTAETTAATRRLRGLSKFSTALAGAVTLDDIARAALRCSLAAFEVDHVGFGVEDGRGWRAVRRLRRELLDEADERLPPLWVDLPPDSALPLVRAAQSGTPLFLDAEDLAEYRRHGTDRHEGELHALAAIPLRTPSLRGGMTFGFRDHHPWLPAERALLIATAELVAQAAERARRFEAQHGASQLLQRSLLPESLPTVDMLRVAARYEPSVDGNPAGGDFYDAFALPGGELAIVLGDVVGHDVRAAALMGQVRAALRALALTDPAPETVLSGLDRLVRSLSDESRTEELFVTVVYGIADPTTGQLCLASAGHPPPLLRRPGVGRADAVFLDVPPGAPLGLEGSRSTLTYTLRAGETVVLFSDGVVERRDRDISVGLDQLAEAVAAAPSGDPRNICSLVVGAIPGTADDDVAVLALEHARAPSRSAALDVPAEAVGPSRVRRWLTEQLRGWGVPTEVAETAVLCASELTTNALLHAGTPARVELDLSPERLLVGVTDTGTRGVVSRTETDPLSTRGRGLGLIEALSDAWGTDRTVRGSTVWFELLLDRGQSAH